MSEGWYWLVNSRKWHYFADGRSLCNKWLVRDNDPKEFVLQRDAPNNCVDCAKRLIRRRTVKPRQQQMHMGIKTESVDAHLSKALDEPEKVI